MKGLNATKTLLLPAFNAARILSELYGEYFVPAEPGIYVRNSESPLLLLDSQGVPLMPAVWEEPERIKQTVLAPVVYRDSRNGLQVMTDSHCEWLETIGLGDFSRKIKEGGINAVEEYVSIPVQQIKTIKDVKGPIKCAFTGKTLVSADDIRKGLCLRPDPTLRACRLIEAFVHQELEDLLRYPMSKERRFNSTLRTVIASSFNKKTVEELVGEISMQLSGISGQLVDFIADETMTIHLVSKIGMDICVEKFVDFRIYDWERRMQSGEWKHA